MRYRNLDDRLLGGMKDGVEVELVVTEFDLRRKRKGRC